MILTLLELFLYNCSFLFYRLRIVKVSEISFLKRYWIQILLEITALWCDTDQQLNQLTPCSFMIRQK